MTAMSLQLNKRFIDDPLFAYHSENISFNAHTHNQEESRTRQFLTGKWKSKMGDWNCTHSFLISNNGHVVPRRLSISIDFPSFPFPLSLRAACKPEPQQTATKRSKPKRGAN